MSGQQRTADQAYEELGSVLGELLDAHVRLVELSERQEVGFRRADLEAVTASVGEQNEVLQRVASLEERRRAVVGEVAAAAGGRAASVRLHDLASSAPEPARDRLVTLAGELKAALEKLQERQGVLRRVAESLSTHMDGLQRQLMRNLSIGVGGVTYTSAGRDHLGASRPAVVDVST